MHRATSTLKFLTGISCVAEERCLGRKTHIARSQAFLWAGFLDFSGTGRRAGSLKKNVKQITQKKIKSGSDQMKNINVQTERTL